MEEAVAQFPDFRRYLWDFIVVVDGCSCDVGRATGATSYNHAEESGVGALKAFEEGRREGEAGKSVEEYGLGQSLENQNLGFVR